MLLLTREFRVSREIYNLDANTRNEASWQSWSSSSTMGAAEQASQRGWQIWCWLAPLGTARICRLSLRGGSPDLPPRHRRMPLAKASVPSFWCPQSPAPDVPPVLLFLTLNIWIVPFHTNTYIHTYIHTSEEVWNKRRKGVEWIGSKHERRLLACDDSIRVSRCATHTNERKPF